MTLLQSCSSVFVVLPTGKRLMPGGVEVKINPINSSRAYPSNIVDIAL
jgi:hypothetical protein